MCLNAYWRELCLLSVEDAEEELDKQQIINIASSVKAIGSDYFRKGDYTTAAEKYNKVCLLKPQVLS